MVVFSPLLAYTALRIKLESPGPVLFWQERMGSGDRRFRMVKFRTMYVDAEERKAELAHLNKHGEDGPTMFKIPDDPRITPFGRFLRRWSIDELPQLMERAARRDEPRRAAPADPGRGRERRRRRPPAPAADSRA